MSDDRPGFFSLSHVDPADSVLIRRGGKAVDEAKQIAEAIAFLEARGFRVIRPVVKPPATPEGCLEV